MKAAFLIFLLLNFTLFADRDLYTCEIVGAATVIGIWKAKDIAAMDFKNPVKLYKGKTADFEGMKFRKGEFRHLLNLNKKQHFIAVRKYKSGCYVRSLDEKMISEVNVLLKQFEEMEKWQKYPVEEQISKSVLIIKGQIKDSGKSCPVSHFIKPDKALKGKLPKYISVYPVNMKLLNKESLLLLQKLPGNGPGFRVMKSVPVQDAGAYLKLLPVK